jgi:membrane associated rhomboid family serine protease
MRLDRRVEDGRCVRTIEWDGGSSSDLSAVVALFVATAICLAAVVGAAQTTGWVRALFVVLAVLSGLLWAAMAAVFLVGGGRRRRRSRPPHHARFGHGTGGGERLCRRRRGAGNL